MSGSRPRESAALVSVQRLAARERRQAGEHADLPRALHDLIAPVFANLRATMGEDGCSALSSRAFARCEWEHPAVAALRGPTDYEIALEKVEAAVESHGPAATASGVEAVLVTLFGILARIIGEDMAISIMDHERARTGTNDGAST